ncbi:MAG: DUF167 domain-containing protein [Methanomicrobiales archaeon]|nr:DUF167 domain-containing protein [Methanomicrobiales archaeon]
MPDDWTSAISETATGTVLALSVTPGAKKDLFPAGFNPWRTSLLCHVRAVAVDGRANQAVISLIAATLALPCSAITILSGMRSSRKQVLVTGFDRATIIGRLRPFFPRT